MEDKGSVVMKITKKHRQLHVRIRTDDSELNQSGWIEISGTMGTVGAHAFYIREDNGQHHYLTNVYWRIVEILS